MYIESFQGVLITSIYEVNEFHDESGSRTVSFILCIIILILEIFGWLTIGCLWCNLRRDTNINNEWNYSCSKFNNWFKELKEDLEQKYFARGFYFIDASKTLIMIVLVLSIHSNQIYCIISIQFIYLVIMITIRPYNKIYLNIIKIQNELYFLFTSLYMVYFKTKGRWDSSLGFLDSITNKISSMTSPETIFILMMTLNCAMIITIIIINFILKCFKKICSSKKSVVPKQPKTKPSPNIFSKSISGVEELKQESSISREWHPSQVQMTKTKKNVNSL